MKVEETAYRFENEKSVVLVIGVNGVGKTTTVGKLAGKLKDQGKRVVIAGADTFRAAAGDQLKEWANRSGVDMIGGVEGADPGSVVYDATAAAKGPQCRCSSCRYSRKTAQQEKFDGMSLEKLIVFWKKNIRKRTARHWLFLMRQLGRML